MLAQASVEIVRTAKMAELDPVGGRVAGGGREDAELAGRTRTAVKQLPRRGIVLDGTNRLRSPALPRTPPEKISQGLALALRAVMLRLRLELRVRSSALLLGPSATRGQRAFNLEKADTCYANLL